MTVFSNGVESVGLVPIERWQEILRHARRRGDFLGMDERNFPLHFSVYPRYHEELRQKISQRRPVPAPIPLERVERFVRAEGGRHGVE